MRRSEEGRYGLLSTETHHQRPSPTHKGVQLQTKRLSEKLRMFRRDRRTDRCRCMGCHNREDSSGYQLCTHLTDALPFKREDKGDLHLDPRTPTVDTNNPSFQVSQISLADAARGILQQVGRNDLPPIQFGSIAEGFLFRHSTLFLICKAVRSVFAVAIHA